MVPPSAFKVAKIIPVDKDNEDATLSEQAGKKRAAQQGNKRRKKRRRILENNTYVDECPTEDEDIDEDSLDSEHSEQEDNDEDGDGHNNIQKIYRMKIEPGLRKYLDATECRRQVSNSIFQSPAAGECGFTAQHLGRITDRVSRINCPVLRLVHAPQDGGRHRLAHRSRKINAQVHAQTRHARPSARH